MMLRDRRHVYVDPRLLPPLDPVKMASVSSGERYSIEIHARSVAANRTKIQEIQTQLLGIQMFSPQYDHLNAQLNHLKDQVRRSYALVEPFQKSIHVAW
jgi:hypothetical protein